MDREPQKDASAKADEVLGQDDPPFHPPVEPASETAEASVAAEGDAVGDSPKEHS